MPTDFSLGSDEYKDSLRRVYEPIVHELDRAYAQSKRAFWLGPRKRTCKTSEATSSLKSRDAGCASTPKQSESSEMTFACATHSRNALQVCISLEPNQTISASGNGALRSSLAGQP